MSPTIEDRFAEFVARANALARELRLEVEFATTTVGHGYMSSEAPAAEVVTTDTHEYLLVPGRLTLGGSK